MKASTGFGQVTQEQILKRQKHKARMEKFWEAGVKIVASAKHHGMGR